MEYQINQLEAVEIQMMEGFGNVGSKPASNSHQVADPLSREVGNAEWNNFGEEETAPVELDYNGEPFCNDDDGSKGTAEMSLGDGYTNEKTVVESEMGVPTLMYHSEYTFDAMDLKELLDEEEDKDESKNELDDSIKTDSEETEILQEHGSAEENAVDESMISEDQQSSSDNEKAAALDKVLEKLAEGVTDADESLNGLGLENVDLRNILNPGIKDVVEQHSSMVSVSDSQRVEDPRLDLITPANLEVASAPMKTTTEQQITQTQDVQQSMGNNLLLQIPLEEIFKYWTRAMLESYSTTVTAVGNLPTKNQQIQSVESDSCGHSWSIKSAKKRQIAKEKFEALLAKLDESNILVTVNSTISRFKGTLIDINDKIITTYGKKVFDIVFDANEIMGGCASSGKANKWKTNFEMGYDPDKICFVERFVSWLLSRPDPEHLTVEAFRNYAIRLAREYGTGLDDKQSNYFTENVVQRYACTRRNQIKDESQIGRETETKTDKKKVNS